MKMKKKLKTLSKRSPNPLLISRNFCQNKTRKARKPCWLPRRKMNTNGLYHTLFGQTKRSIPSRSLTGLQRVSLIDWRTIP